MDGFFNDACTTAMSRVHALGPPKTRDTIAVRETITAFLHSSYSAGLSPNIDSISSESLYRMAAFHISVARPLAYLYARWALANLADAAASSSAGPSHATSGQIGQSDLNLSRSEEVRIYRAIYRHETFYHLFGQKEGRNDSAFHVTEVLSLFFHKFEPWESEAIWCINVFLKHAYSSIFETIRQDGAQSMYEHVSPWPEWKETYEGAKDPAFKQFLQDTIALGLQTSARLLQLTDPAELRSTAQELLEPSKKQHAPAPARAAVEAPYTPAYMPFVLSQSCPYALRGLRLLDPDEEDDRDPRDEAEARRDPIAFLGDDDDDAAAEAPPIAWVRLWSGRYSHLYGENVPPTVQRWGYVMWDARRWDGLGALGLVARQWQAAPAVGNWIETMYHWSPTEDGDCP
ncbi:hypothetical protein PG991_006563 [Apiospora marii]|uniref:Uncharacterized protein n=1 Tax=Apiospora marii TaxID=335849 RepID=A0ABR1RZH1_9PEZI